MGYVPVKSLSSVLLLCLGLQSRDSHTSTMGHLAIIVQLLYNLDGLQFIESSPKAQSPDITPNNHLGCSSQYLCCRHLLVDFTYSHLSSQNSSMSEGPCSIPQAHITTVHKDLYVHPIGTTTSYSHQGCTGKRGGCICCL